MELKFKRVRDEYGDVTYVAKPDIPTVASYEIEPPQNGYGWDVRVMRDSRYLMTPEYAHNFGKDNRMRHEYRTLREARAACERHAEAELTELAGAVNA